MITEHPESTYVAKNDPATLRCQAEGDPSPEISWWKDGNILETATSNPKVGLWFWWNLCCLIHKLYMVFKTIYNYFFIYFYHTQSHRVILPSGSLFFLRAAYSRRENDGGLYWCNATNSEGSAVSKNVTLTVAGEEICQSDQTFIKVDEQKNQPIVLRHNFIQTMESVLQKEQEWCVHTTQQFIFIYLHRRTFYIRKLSNRKNVLTLFCQECFFNQTKNCADISTLLFV